MATDALSEEVLRPGTSNINEDGLTHEPEEKFVYLKSINVLTGTHTPSRKESKKHSIEDEPKEGLSYDPGKDASFVTSDVGECTPVHFPEGHRKDAGITDSSREVNTDSSDLKAIPDSKDTHLRNLTTFLYHALNEVLT